MKKLSILLLTVVLAAGVIGCKKKEEKKVESSEQSEQVEEIEVEVEDVEEEIEAEESPTIEEEVENNQAPVANTESGKKPTISTTNNISATKPSSNQQVTQPSGGHTHSWAEVKTAVQVPEQGHYEDIYAWKKTCSVCEIDMETWTYEEREAHTLSDECPGESITKYKKIGQEWIVDTPATTEYRVTSYKCSCGATREKTQYAGMYSVYDQTSWDRLEACKQFFAKGLAGADSDVYKNSIQYGNWESVVVCNGSTNGAWMWVFIRHWKLDNYDYLKDTVAQGIIDQAEADMVKALYEEIPSIFKGAIECIAPQGGTEVYNYVVKLINQANGDLVEVPNLSGAKGIIPENIPGLYVTIEETRGGFSVMFWAE